MRYRVSFEMENVIDVEDGHDLTEDEVTKALTNAAVDDARNSPWDSVITVEATGDEEVEPTYALRLSANPPAYEGGPRLVRSEVL